MVENALFIGKQVGNYRIIAPIASGAYSSVYKAQHITFSNRFVAVKIMRTHFDTEEEQQFFFREAQFLERLRHRYILPLLDIGMLEDIPYFLLEYAGGGSLKQRLAQLAPRLLPPRESLTLLRQLGEAISYAHQQNVIHRDLKPANILFSEQGEVRLADFGLATLLATVSLKHSQGLGTPLYMAPEQFRGEICKENDQYALACVTYELCTGHQPFSGSDQYSIAFKHMNEPPIPPRQHNPHLPPYIEQAILKAMSKERKARYPDVAAFVQALITPPAVSTAPVPAPLAQPSASSLQPTPDKTTKRQLRLDVAQLTDVGRVRPYNQDNMAYVVPKDPRIMEQQGALFIVADGGCSGQAGEVASKMAVDIISKKYYQNDTRSVEEMLLRAMREANALIFQRRADETIWGFDMITSCTSVVLRGAAAYIAHVGNCRAYLIRQGTITPITQNHTWVEEQIREGRLSIEQAYSHLERHVLTRVFGLIRNLDIDLFAENLKENDTLLLCSDGLYEQIDDPSLLAIMERYTPQESVYHLVERANKLGGSDNITAMVIRVLELG